MMCFTSQAAYEASVEDDEPIMLNPMRARKLIREHKILLTNEQFETVWNDFLTEVGIKSKYDAWAILKWLGY
jgi:hypothetical protein